MGCSSARLLLRGKEMGKNGSHERERTRGRREATGNTTLCSRIDYKRVNCRVSTFNGNNKCRSDKCRRQTDLPADTAILSRTAARLWRDSLRLSYVERKDSVKVNIDGSVAIAFNTLEVLELYKKYEYLLQTVCEIDSRRVIRKVI